MPHLIVERAKRGDRDAFRRLVETHSPQVFRVAFRIVGDEATAEDVVQEAFLRAYRQLASFDGRSQFSTWLFRIATNAAIDAHRRLKRRPEDPFAEDADDTETPPLVSELPDPGRRAESAEIAAAATQALDGLTAMERAAFSLRHFEGYSIAEISSTLGIRQEASKQAIFRAVKKMRHVLEPFLRPTLWSRHEA